MEAWNVYIQVLAAHYPHRTPALLAYQNIICSASTRFPPRCWLRYDQRFRASAAADKTLRWDHKLNDLWLECFTQPSPSQQQQTSTTPSTSSKLTNRRPCTYCGNFYHYPDNCPVKPFRPTHATPGHIASTPTERQTAQPSLTPSTNPTPPQHSNTQPLPHHCRDFNNGRIHHHVTLKSEARADLQRWQDFLPDWPGTSLLLESHWSFAPDMELFTDASDIGHGGFWAGRWFSATWTIKLYTIIVACTTWGPHWKHKRILFHCDNAAVVSIWQRGSCKSTELMALV